MQVMRSSLPLAGELGVTQEGTLPGGAEEVPDQGILAVRKFAGHPEAEIEAEGQFRHALHSQRTPSPI